MDKKQIKMQAEQFCQDNGINEYPVKIVNICNQKGIKVFEEYINPDVSGLIVVDEKEWEKYGTNKFIVVNLADSPERRRFTIAHELAHYVLHRRDNLLYAHRDVNNQSLRQNEIEAEANYFATNILMPENLVRERVEDIKKILWGVAPNFTLVNEVADSFLVSKKAAEVRLKQLGLI